MTAVASHVLSTAELIRLLADRPRTRLLDVRTPGEFESEHIEGAYNVPLDTLGEHGAEIRAAVVDPVVLVCRSGHRARKAEEALQAAGMDNLYVLDGGMNAWATAAQPVRRGVPRMSLERQVRIAAGTLAATGAFLALFVNPLFAALPAFVGSGLVFAGVTDTCAMGMLLARLPYNRRATCDVPAMVRALAAGAAPAGAHDRPSPRRARQLMVGAALLAAALPVGARAQADHAGHASHASPSSDSAAVVAVVSAYHRALEAADSTAALAMLASEVMILESGGIETRDEYRNHHLPGDIGFARAVPSMRTVRQVKVHGPTAWVSGTSVVQGTYNGRAVNSTGAELMVLTKGTDGQWRIAAIHWSSRARRNPG